jgi:hypothetical protein
VNRPTYATGRQAPLMISPATEITARFPSCTGCTWVAAGNGWMRLKYFSAMCPVHLHLPRTPA